MSITTVGNQIVHYEAVGHGEPLLFLHGWAGSWRYWWPAMQTLATHYRSFALDLWGFGDSSKSRENYTIAAYVDLVQGFCERLGLSRPFSLVGHGLGGVVAIRVAANWPDAVDKIAIVSVPLTYRQHDSHFEEMALNGQLLTALASGSGYPEIVNEVHKADPQALIDVMTELNDQRFLMKLQLVDAPLLVVYGRDDSWLRQTAEMVSAVNNGNPARKAVLLEASGHFPMLDEPARFNRLILDFLKGDRDLSDLAPKQYWQRRTH